MRSSAQQKMCWNCEGNVQLQEDVCPYCQTNLDQAGNPLLNASLSDGSILYPSAYNPSKIIPATSFAIQEEEEESQERPTIHHENSLLAMTMSLALLMSGLIFFVFALVLFGFSHDGKLTLAWNSNYWYVYALLALPLLFFGWRSLQNLEEERAD